jgi:hypothetical protein
MRYATQIEEIAQKFARLAHESAVRLKRELAEIETRKSKIAANLARERLASFQPEIGGDLQCPRCWIDHEMRASLVAIPATGPSKEDAFRCHACGFDLSFSFQG